jgi:ribonuclease P protein component
MAARSSLAAAPRAVRSSLPKDSPKIPRLKKRAEFLAAQAANRKFVTPGMIVQARAQKPEERFGLRLGFTVSKKVGNAVQRNRAKRRLRAAAAETLGPYIASAYDVVMIGRTETLTRDYKLLCADLAQAVKRLGVA